MKRIIDVLMLDNVNTGVYILYNYVQLLIIVNNTLMGEDILHQCHHYAKY